MRKHINSSLQEADAALAALTHSNTALDAIEHCAAILIEVFKNKGRVYTCGNGGSMCDAMHFAEELTGRYRHDRAALPATAISDAGHLSCVSNDLGYEYVFSRYIEAHGRANDCLVALSTSGTSNNILKAAEAANSIGMKVIILSGRRNEHLEKLTTMYLCTPGGKFADRVQEVHIKILHIFIELIERELFPMNYIDSF